MDVGGDGIAEGSAPLRREANRFRLWVRRLIYVFAFLVMVPEGVHAGDRVAEFLSVPVDAASAGAGGADVARSLSQLSPFANPAAAATTRTTGGVSHVSWLADQNVSAAHLRMPLPGRAGGVAVYGLWMDHGEIPRFDLTGSEAPALNPRDLSLGAAYGYQLGRFSFGAGVRYIEEDLAIERGTGMAYDFGVILNAGQWRMGASALGVGGSLKYEDGTNFDIPRRLALGLSYRPWRDNLEADLQLANLSDVDGNVGSIGLHWHALPGTLVFRGGADLGGEASGDEFKGYRFGFGVAHAGVSIDYAFVPHQELGHAHLFGVRIGGR